MVVREQSFLVEDFIESIAAQLDRVQDTLRLKALNRPLTYALKDLSLDLNVFVTMDEEGNVRFRTSAPNEEGSSTVKIGFTTITRPMIEENTVELSLTRSPTLDELGLEADERRQLHKLGVRNAAQLDRLYKRTSTATVSRFSGIAIDRLRNAIQVGQPRVDRIRPERPERPPQRPERPTTPTIPRHPESGGRTDGFPPRPDRVPKPPRQIPDRKKTRPRLADARTTPIRTAPGVDRLRLVGRNIFGAQGLPTVSLNHLPLRVIEADDNEMVVGLPDMPESGLLEINLPDSETLAFDLIMADVSVPGALDFDYPDEYTLSDGKEFDSTSAMSDAGDPNARQLAQANHDPASQREGSDAVDIWAPRPRHTGRQQP